MSRFYTSNSAKPWARFELPFLDALVPGEEEVARPFHASNVAACTCLLYPFTEPHAFEGRIAGEGAISWFRRLLSVAGVEPTDDELNRGAAAVPPGADGLVVSLDWLGPSDQQWRREPIVGLDGSQGAFHVYRAILEALAVTTQAADARARQEVGRTLQGLIVTGRGSASMTMLQILAAVYGVPVRVPAVSDAVAIGMHGS